MRLGRLGHSGIDQGPRGIDEQAVLNLAPGGGGCRGRDSSGLHRRAVGDDRVAVDAFEHDRPVAYDRVEVGGGREGLFRPQFLVPAETENPFGVGIGGGVIAKPLLELGKRAGAGQIQPQGRKTEVHHMPMGVDEAREQGLALAIDHLVHASQLHHHAFGDDLLHLPVVANDEAGEMLELSVSAHLHSVHVVDDGGRPGGRGEEGGGERGQGLAFHYARIALSAFK